MIPIQPGNPRISRPYPLNHHPVGGGKVPEIFQPADRHNHFKKSSMRFDRDAFALPSRCQAMQSLVGKLV